MVPMANIILYGNSTSGYWISLLFLKYFWLNLTTKAGVVVGKKKQGVAGYCLKKPYAPNIGLPSTQNSAVGNI